MSLAPEEAVANLRACIAQLTPTLLQHIAALRSTNPSDTFLPPTLVFSSLSPLTASDEVKRAFALVPPPSSDAAEGSQDQQTRIRNLCLEVATNELRGLVLEVSKPPALPQGPTTDTLQQQQLDDATLCQIVDRLDAVLSLSLNDLVDTGLPLVLIEELLELNTVSTCSQLFFYIESRVTELTIGLHPTRGKGLVLLRLCNELLRRLSKPSRKHTVFAGRILSLLAAVFPLGERSGVNLRGDFNVENKTVLEDEAATPTAAQGNTDEEADEDDKNAVLRPDSRMYELFWSMQRFFANPPLLMGAENTSRQSSRAATPAAPTTALQGDESAALEEDPAPDGAKGPMVEFRISTRKILDLFAAVAKREKELAGAAAAEGVKTGTATSTGKAVTAQVQRPAICYRAGLDLSGSAQLVSEGGDGGKSRKRKREDGTRTKEENEMQEEDNHGDSKNENDSENQNEPGDSDTELETDTFFPKYLTGRKLLEYEIRDPSFRRHILVQYLILFQYLLSFTAAAREKWKDWKNKSLQALFVLEEADEQWMRKTWKEVLALLREIPPNGRVFHDTVLEVLKREANWIRWKTESCPSIEKPPLSSEQVAAFANARAMLLKPPTAYPHPLGTAALSELWQDGFPPPVPGTRRSEDELGNEIEVATDGLEELEFLPPVPSLNHYYGLIKREEMKLTMRRRQLGIEAEGGKMSKEERDKEDKDEKAQSIREAMQSLAWRALRVASGEHLHLFSSMKGPENVHALMKAIELERNPPPAPVEKPAEVKVEEEEEKPDEGKKQGAGTESQGQAASGASAKPTEQTEPGEPGSDADAAATTIDAATAEATATVPVEVPEVPASPAPPPTAAAQAASGSATPDPSAKKEEEQEDKEETIKAIKVEEDEANLLGEAIEVGITEPGANGSTSTEADKDVEMGDATS